MKDTKIRWCDDTWNPMTGCSRVSEGCRNCYAETIAVKFRGRAFPNGFVPTFKPEKLALPERWRTPRRVFVNSMSDVHHPAFSYEEVAAVWDVMRDVSRHQYLVLTKRPDRMAAFLEEWLPANNVTVVPDHIWVGTSIESDRWTNRADTLRGIPADIRFLSLEPLLEPLPSLDMTGIGWVIVGGESGSGYRPMSHEWARTLRTQAAESGAAFFFKQSAAFRTETGVELDGERVEEWPAPHPADSMHA